MRWGTPNESLEGINFDEIFAMKDFSTAKLLALDNIIEEVKRQNEKVTTKLLTNQEVLKELMCICLKPEKFNHSQIQALTNDHTFKAIEILSNLTEEFSDFLFASAQTKPEGSDDDHVITEEISNSYTPPHPLFMELISILNEPKPITETPLAYLVKIVTTFSYQKPREIILAISKIPNFSERIFEHFYSRSIFQWFIRLLESEDSNSFYEKQKLMFFQKCIAGIDSETDQDLLLSKLESYEAIFQVLLEKIDDRFDKSKFSSMVKQLLIEQNCINVLFMKINQYPENFDIWLQVFSIFEVYLRFSSNHRSLNASKNSENLQNSIYQIRLNNDSVKEIKQVLIINMAKIIHSENTSKNLIRKYLQLLKALIIFDNQLIPELITKESIEAFLLVMIKNPSNNILHNLIKDLIIQSANKSFQKVAPLLFTPDNKIFIEIVRKCSKVNSKTQNQYQNQIYHIFQALKRKGEQNLQTWNALISKIQDIDEILQKIKEKQTFYNKMIGGNARKQSSCWGDSSAEIVFEKIFPGNSNSDKKIDMDPVSNGVDFIDGNQNDHWFDCGGLPLDSDESKDENSMDDLSLKMNSPQSSTLQAKPENLELKVESAQEIPVTQFENSDFFINPDMTASRKMDEEKITKNSPDINGTSFNNYFTTYESYQLEEVLSELQ